MVTDTDINNEKYKKESNGGGGRGGGRVNCIFQAQ